MFTFLFLCAAVYGATRVAKYAKNNPGTTMQAASWLKQMFGK